MSETKQQTEDLELNATHVKTEKIYKMGLKENYMTEKEIKENLNQIYEKFDSILLDLKSGLSEDYCETLGKISELKNLIETNGQVTEKINNGLLQHLLDIESTIEDYPGQLDDVVDALISQIETNRFSTVTTIESIILNHTTKVSTKIEEADRMLKDLLILVWSLTIINAVTIGSIITLVIHGVLS